MEKIKIAAVIAEFNPFHNGHKYIVEKARELSGCTHVLIIQSGNFTQRAEPAIADKHMRAKAACMCGADAVVEIPVAYATGNAEVFAKASVQIAASFPYVTHLVFGTEDNDLSVLKTVANALVNRKKEFNKYIKHHLKMGLSFDSARNKVVKKMLSAINQESIDRVLKNPNNILALEYIKELTRLRSEITPLGVVRVSNNYTDTELSGHISSATSIRFQIEKDKKGTFEILKKCIPEEVFEMTKKGLENAPDFELFGASVLYKLRTDLDAKRIYNCNEEIKNIITNLSPCTYEELKKEAPTKRFTVSRMARVTLHCTIGVTKRDVKFLYRYDCLPYTKLLAINENASSLFGVLCTNSRTPLIVRGNRNKPKNNAYCKALQKIDKRAEILYEIVCKTKSADKPVFVKK